MMVFLAGRYEWRARHGYCFQQDRYLTAEELGMSAIAHVYRDYIEGFDHKRDRNYGDRLFLNDGEELITYKSVEEFKRKAVLNCCNPKAYDSWESRRKRPNTGRYSYYKTIRFRYKRDTLTGLAETQGFGAASVSMDSCGGQAKAHLTRK